MIQQRHRLRTFAFLLGDIAAVVAAFFAAWVLRFELEVIPLTRDVPEFGPYLHLLPAIVVLWPLVFYFHGLYRIRRGASRVDELLTVLVATLLSSVLLSGLSAWYRPPMPSNPELYFTYSRAFLGLLAICDLVFTAISRLVLRAVLKRRLRGARLQRILIVGAGRLGQEVTAKLLAHRDLGIEVIGFLDDAADKRSATILGRPVLGTLADAATVLDERGVDQVYVALPLDAHRKMQRLLRDVAQECVEVKIVPDVLQYATLKATLEDLDGTPVINMSQVPLQGWSSLAKRTMDVVLSGAGMLVLLPFLPIIALAIWLDDKGPIFYRQERMGLDGKPFQIWKFRSMRMNAEASTGPVWAVRDDPRRTGVGAFIRQWSIDELPQLWNVFVGDMSLVGPRPERPVFVREFRDKLPDYMHRHRVKAGITGWAQVHGWRGNTSIKKRLEYDLYYVQNWSLLLDLRILWMTFRYALRLNAH
jgi:exopolysaccharide biosynthesis polyprenyl glycosylphosphotransferase